MSSAHRIRGALLPTEQKFDGAGIPLMSVPISYILIRYDMKKGYCFHARTIADPELNYAYRQSASYQLQVSIELEHVIMIPVLEVNRNCGYSDVIFESLGYFSLPDDYYFELACKSVGEDTLISTWEGS